MRFTTAIVTLAIAGAGAGAAYAGSDPQRDVQFRSLDLGAGVLEVHNYGATLMPLDGWRFCSHSSGQARRYTGASALNGVSLDPGESMFLYINNDAPVGDLNFNVGDLGNFANNFGQGPFAVQFFWPNGGSLSFGSIDDMVDHVQWSVNGVNNPVAGTRSQQAVDAGLWTSANAWISTSGNSLSWSLNPAGGLLHGPGDYTVNEPPMSCNPADIAEPFGVLDLADISAFVAAFTSAGDDADIAEPFGVLDLADITAFIGAFTGGCP